VKSTHELLSEIARDLAILRWYGTHLQSNTLTCFLPSQLTGRSEI
jgi:hypothetical protein